MVDNEIAVFITNAYTNWLIWDKLNLKKNNTKIICKSNTNVNIIASERFLKNFENKKYFHDKRTFYAKF